MGGPTPSRRQLLSAVAGLGTSLGLAGCGDSIPQSFVATPVGLTTAGRAYLNLPSAGYEEVSQTRTAGDLGEITITSHLTLYRRPREHELPVSFQTPDPTARSVGILSTPRGEVAGQNVNPLAWYSIGELIESQIGRELIAQTNFIDTPDFDWERGPERVASLDVELMGTETTLESYYGVVSEGDGPGTAILMNLGRFSNDADTVLMGDFHGRQESSNVLGEDNDCIDLKCQLRKQKLRELQDAIGEIGIELQECPPHVQRQTGHEMCPAGGGGGGGGGDGDDDEDDGNDAPPTEEWPKIGVKNVRIVQEVEDTVVVNPNNGNTVYTAPEPDLVFAEDTAVVFELTGFDNLDKLSGPVEIEITHGSRYAVSQPSKRFTLSQQDIRDIDNGEHTISVLHRNANDNDPGNDNPVFSLGSDPSITLEVGPYQLIQGGFAFADRADKSNIIDLRALRVGIIGIHDPGDGSNYGTSNGNPRAFTRSANSAVEYIQRAFPGNVVAYAHQAHWVNGTQSVYKDFKRAKTVLDKMAANSSYPSSGPGFPSGGKLYNNTQFGDSTVESDIKNEGFDVTVAVVPNDDSSNSGATSYFDWHDKNWAGVYTGKSRAVAFTGAAPGNQDRWASTVAAQEIGHYLQDDYRNPSGHPLAQRDDDGNDTQVNNIPVDSAHARHQNSDLRDRDTDGDGNIDVNNPPDPPGVISTGYDLDDGSFDNVQSFTLRNGTFSANGPNNGAGSIGQIPSYMSYHPNQTKMWADARVHQDMIDLNRTWQNQSGSGSTGFMMTATASVTDDDGAEYDSVTAFQGYERFVDLDDGPVTVSMRGPEGEVLERTRVRNRIPVSHGADVLGRATVTIPFPPAAVEVVTAYGGTTSRMNPVVRSIRDAVERVPREAFRDNPEAVRDELIAALNQVADLMAEGEYSSAADVLEEDVERVIDAEIGSHERGLGAPTGQELLGLVVEMIRRLRALS